VKSGLKGLVGVGPTGWSPEIQFVNTIAPIATAMVANKLIDGRWPWDIPGLPFGAIRIHRGEKKVVDIPLSLWAQPIGRGLRYSGLQSVADAVLRGEREPMELFNEGIDGIRRAWLGRMAPIGRAVSIAATGKSPAGYPVSGPTPADKLKAALLSLNSAGKYMEGREHREFESPAAKIIMGVIGSVGLRPSVKGPESELRGLGVRIERGKVAQRAMDIVRQASLKSFASDQEKIAWIADQIQRKIGDDPQDVGLAWQQIRRDLRGRPRSYARSAAMAEGR
jgi:hypothetical protein